MATERKVRLALEPFSRMRSEGFPFNFGSLRVERCSRDVAFMSATVRMCLNVIDKAVPMGEAFDEVLDGRLKCQIPVKERRNVTCGSVEVDFVAQV